MKSETPPVGNFVSNSRPIQSKAEAKLDWVDFVSPPPLTTTMTTTITLTNQLPGQGVTYFDPNNKIHIKMGQEQTPPPPNILFQKKIKSYIFFFN